MIPDCDPKSTPLFARQGQLPTLAWGAIDGRLGSNSLFLFIADVRGGLKSRRLS